MPGPFTHLCTAPTRDVANRNLRLTCDGLGADQILDPDLAKSASARCLTDLNQGHLRWGSAGDPPSADGRQGG